MNQDLIKLLSEEKIFPILRSNSAQCAIDTARALADGGVKILEVNVENPQIFCAIEEISKHVIVCAGNIITSIQAKAALEAGARMISSPIFQMNMVKLSKDKKVPFIAGTSTANEAYNAWKARMQLIKIYPITAMGGAKYIENLLRPMPFLKLMPLGDVKLTEVKSYIDAGAPVVGVGRDLYDGYTYAEITQRIRSAREELGI